MRRNICSGVLTVCCVVFPVSQGLAQNTCSARCPNGSMSEAYACNSNYVPRCLREVPAPNPNVNNNNDAAAAAAEAEAAADAKRQRDAELEQQRIDAENQRLAEEAAKQAQFNRDKSEALGQLKGIANGDGFDSGSGLKGVGSADSGLKDTSSSVDSSGLKTLPTENTDTSVVDLSDTNLEDANKALMRHQWAMSIDQRYKDDPEVQQYIRDLWKDATRGNNDPARLGCLAATKRDQRCIPSDLGKHSVNVQFFIG